MIHGIFSYLMIRGIFSYFQVNPPKGSSTHNKSFGKTSSERHLSFSERKQLLIENARQKYMEKHGML